MDTKKHTNSKESDSGKPTKPNPETGENNSDSLKIIPSDSILAEKDEVKIAEERLRLKKNKLKGGN